MKRGLSFVLGMTLLVGSVQFVVSQEPAGQEDMRFISALRQRGDHDLVRAFLERLKKNPPPGLADVLPLEIARTRLAEASEEPDSGKRLSIYNEARTEFENFLAKNPKTPRAAEIRRDVAQVAVLQGKVLLSKALTQDTLAAKRTEGARARLALEDAGKKLKDVARELDLQIERADKAAAKPLQEERERTELTIGLNLLDQGLSFPAADSKIENIRERSDRVKLASKVLDRLAAGDANDPITWQAKAWLGRCLQEMGEKGAKKAFQEIVEARGQAVTEGQRLARYFYMLVLEEEKDKAAIIEADATKWLRDYPKAKNTPEGYGVRYLLAQIHIGKAEQGKQKEAELKKARDLLREIEQTENDFTDRARRAKLGVIAKQGGFEAKIDKLKTFEDCYVRAQYEIHQMNEEAKNAKGGDEKARQQRIENARTALQRGLELPDAKGKKSLEIGNARVMLAYFDLNTKRYKEALKVGEDFARDDPTSAQAANAAMYALQAYSQSIGDRELMLENSTGDLRDEQGNKVDEARFREDLKNDRQRMVEFARHMLKVWPHELVADLARHQLAMLLIREKVSDEQHAKNIQEASKSLGGISKSYPSYVRAMYLLSETAFQAEKDKLPEPKELAGVTWHQQAIKALESIPDQVSDDPEVNQVFMLARCKLGEELYKEKKFEQMDQLAKPLLAKLPGMKLNDNSDKEKEMRQFFQSRLMTIQLFGKYGLADAAYTAGDHAKVAALTDPLVDEVRANKDHPIKHNLQLGQALLGMALRSSVQMGKVDRARAIVEALQQIAPEGGGSTTILKQLVALINKQLEELHAKGNKEQIKKAIDGFSAILGELTKNAKMTTDFALALAQCYSTMELHGKAIELLSALSEPKPDPATNQVDEMAQKLYRGSRLMLVRQLRLNKEAKKAGPIIDEIIGTREKPGWGHTNIDALKERLYILVDEGKYIEGHNEAARLVKLLTKRTEDNTMKNHYLDCYYEMVFCLFKYGQGQKDEKKKEKYISDAAKMIEQLEKRFPGFGNDVTAKRFQDLFKAEPDLKTQYDKIKAAAAAAG